MGCTAGSERCSLSCTFLAGGSECLDVCFDAFEGGFVVRAPFRVRRAGPSVGFVPVVALIFGQFLFEFGPNERVCGVISHISNFGGIVMEVVEFPLCFEYALRGTGHVEPVIVVVDELVVRCAYAVVSGGCMDRVIVFPITVVRGVGPVIDLFSPEKGGSCGLAMWEARPLP